MGQAAIQLQMTSQDFMIWDATQTLRHEFVGGEVFAMAGASEAHVTVALNVAMALRQHLQGSPCRTFITDMKLRVEAADAYFYPDVMVCCSAADAGSPLIKRDPVLLVEVLSLSTAAYDRGDKFAAYRSLSGLQEVLFIDTDSRRCDLFRRGEDGLWVLHPCGAEDAVLLQSIDLNLSAKALWAEVPTSQESGPPASQPPDAGG